MDAIAVDYFTLANRHRARKDYNCEDCGGEIRKGDQYVRIARAFRGRPTSGICICDSCARSRGGRFLLLFEEGGEDHSEVQMKRETQTVGA